MWNLCKAQHFDRRSLLPALCNLWLLLVIIIIIIIIIIIFRRGRAQDSIFATRIGWQKQLGLWNWRNILGRVTWLKNLISY